MRLLAVLLSASSLPALAEPAEVPAPPADVDATEAAPSQRRATPCKDDPRYGEFDFWAGDWDQTWVDPSGQVIVPAGGGLVDGAMVLRGTLVAVDGKAWTVWFDGRYQRRPGSG